MYCLNFRERFKNKGGVVASMKTEYFTTIQSISDAVQTSRNTVSSWAKRSTFPAKTANGWPVGKVLEFAIKAKASAAKAMTGENSALRAEKLRLECDRLKELIRVEVCRAEGAEIDNEKKRGQFITVDELRETLTELCHATRHGLGCFVERVKGRRDVELLMWAEDATDAAIAAIHQKITES